MSVVDSVRGCDVMILMNAALGGCQCGRRTVAHPQLSTHVLAPIHSGPQPLIVTDGDTSIRNHSCCGPVAFTWLWFVTQVSMFAQHCESPFTVEQVRVIYADGTSYLSPDLGTR